MASVGIYNYHRGIEWEWLNPFFVQGELNCGSTDQAYRRYVRGQVAESIGEEGIGGLSELHDMRGQLGADFQGWSMAGFLQSLRLFAGVQVDALHNTVRICPSLPKEWPYLRSRHRIGNTRFELRYEQPVPTSHRLELHFLDEPLDHYELHFGFRAPQGARVEAATCNGKDMALDAWSYGDGCVADGDGTVWTAPQFQRDIVVQVDLTEAG